MDEDELERDIAAWRAAAGFAERPEILDELETHLRDAVAELVPLGTAPREALRLAIERLGPPEDLAREFAKTQPVALPWWPARLVGLIFVAIALATVWLLGPRLRQGGTAALLAVHMGLVTVGYVAAVCAGLLAACFLAVRLARDPLPGEKRTLRRAARRLALCATAFTAAGIALGALCPFEKRGWFFGLSTHEVGGLAILAWNGVLLGALLRMRPSARIERRMLLAIGASALVHLGWFGAHLVDGSAPWGGGAVLLLALLGVHALLAAAAFAPPDVLRPD